MRSMNTVQSPAVLKKALSSAVGAAGAALIGLAGGGTVGDALAGIVYPEQFGAVGDGATDDTAAIKAARDRAFAIGGVLEFNGGKTYLTTDIKFDNTNAPRCIRYNGCTLKAAAGTSVLVEYENPQIQSSDPQAFVTVGSVYLDAAGIASRAMRIHGMQFCRLGAHYCRNAVSYGCLMTCESGYGIYYSSADIIAEYNGSDGVHAESLDSSYRNAANDFRIHANFNKGHGARLDYFQNDIFLSAEKNDLYAARIDNTRSLNIVGGYSESNHQNWATDGVSDGGDDESFSTTANTRGFKIKGGRHIGNWVGTKTGAGNDYSPTNKNPESYYPAKTETGNHTQNGDHTVTGDTSVVDMYASGTVEVGGQLVGKERGSETVAAGGAYTIARSRLGTNKAGVVIVKVSGANHYAHFCYWALGASGTPTITQMAQVGDITIALSGSDLQITNSGGASRTVDYSILPMVG